MRTFFCFKLGSDRPFKNPFSWRTPPEYLSDSTFDEEETQREFDEAIAGDDYYDDYGHDESVFDTFDDHLIYG
jgi:hypothetical protein